MARKILTLYFCVILIITPSFALEVRPCGKRPLPLKVTVDGCEKEPCKVVNKKNIHFAIDFVSGKLRA